MKLGLKLPTARPRSIAKDPLWYKNRGDLLDDEVIELRNTVEQFCADLEKDGLTGTLLAKELRSRLAKIKRYA